MQISGKHLIAGEWLTGSGEYLSTPVNGEPRKVSKGSPALVDMSVKAAEKAFRSYAVTSIENRAEFLNTIADEIEKQTDNLVAIATQETGLPDARIVGETARTTAQLRFFADHILKRKYLDQRHDVALPKRLPIPRPEIFMQQKPIGPVVVFGASNFPLAFSTAGGDTAAALAAGCPVIVKAHAAHPGTGELVAQAVFRALKVCKLDVGVFGFIQDDGYTVGEALVKHSGVQAVAFTGGLCGGRALFDLCAQRLSPIPFFGELGSINPVFLLPHALDNRAQEIAEAWAASVVLGAGQFCTNPGVLFALEGSGQNTFCETALSALNKVPSQLMLTEAIANSYYRGCEQINNTVNVERLLINSDELPKAGPSFFRVDAETWLDNPQLAEEVFGPVGVIVSVKNQQQLTEVAEKLHGQLTCTLQMDDEDLDIAQKLMPILETKAGRILANGYSTGVEICDAMVHGGPYPASTNFGATSVGSLSIRRFLRAVSYQNLPKILLPKELRENT